jgi:hypothetical protein
VAEANRQRRGLAAQAAAAVEQEAGRQLLLPVFQILAAVAVVDQIILFSQARQAAPALSS